MITLLIISCFFIYAILESISLIPRVAGSILNSNGLGYTFSVMVSTLKRIFIVAYPPLLGWLTSTGTNLYSAIFYSYLSGAVGITIVILLRRSITRFFIVAIDNYSSGASLLTIFFTKKYSKRNFLSNELNTGFFKFDVMLVISSTWIYFIYSSSLFFINLYGAMYKENSAIIYQLVGLINALGTLLMSFFLDPRLSKNFDKKSNIGPTYNSVVAGQFLAIALVGPVAISVFYFIFQK